MKKSILLFFIIGFVACNKDENNEGNLYLGYNYFPLALNSSSIFEVDSISFDEFTGNSDTLHFFIRERIEEEYIDLQGDLAYKVGVSSRESDTLPWKFEHYKIVKRLSTRIEIQEENLTSIPFIFPIQKGGKWDANARNILPIEQFEFDAIHFNENINQNSYDSLVLILEKDVENLIEKQYAESKYASRYGLVYHYEVDLKTALNGNIISGYKKTLNRVFP